MLFQSIALLASAGTVAAQSSTTSLFLLDADPSQSISMGVQVISSEENAKTSYTLFCPDDVATTDCALGMAEGYGMTYVDDVTKGAVTLIKGLGMDVTRTIQCSIEIDTGSHTSTDATCTGSIVASSGSSSTSQVDTTSFHDVVYYPVTVSAGEVTPTSTSMSTSPTSSETDAAETGDVSASSSESADPESTASETGPTGAAPRVTGAVGVVLGGVVAAMGAAL